MTSSTGPRRTVIGSAGEAARAAHGPLELDGCDLELADDELVDDADLDGLVLYADIDPTDADAIERRRLEWQELLS